MRLWVRPSCSSNSVYRAEIATCASSTITNAGSRSQAYSGEPRQICSFASVATTRCGRSSTGVASLLLQRRLITRDLSAPTLDQTKLQLCTACSQSSSVWAIQRIGPLSDPLLRIQRMTPSEVTRVFPAPVGRLSIARCGTVRSNRLNRLTASRSW